MEKETTMSEMERDDLAGTGYFLPEDGQLRLKKLCSHLRFLAQLAQPRTWEEEQERAPEIYVGELAICMEVLADQSDLVLEALSWPAHRRVEGSASGSDAETAAEPPDDEAAGRYSFGVTLDQIDALDRLIQTIAAHGDVLAAGGADELSGRTLPLLGQAIHEAATTVRGILDGVEAQRLERDEDGRSGVGEGRAAYDVALAERRTRGASRGPGRRARLGPVSGSAWPFPARAGHRALCRLGAASRSEAPPWSSARSAIARKPSTA